MKRCIQEEPEGLENRKALVTFCKLLSLILEILLVHFIDIHASEGGHLAGISTVEHQLTNEILASPATTHNEHGMLPFATL